MAARTYKRDSRGRFAGGGGSSGGGSKAKASAKPAGDGRRGPRGGKTGTRAEQRKAAAAQAARSAEFRGKATAGRGAKDAYKTAARGARMSEKGAAKKVGRLRTPRANPVAQRPAVTPRKVDLSMSAIARRRARASIKRSYVVGGAYNAKLDIRSRTIRSAANAIYNRQRQVAKASGGTLNAQVARSPIGILRTLSGSTRQRADQLREQARKRVVAGRRGRR